jgi:hypothetical protein
VWTAVSVDSKFGQLCYPLTIREVWAASLDSCKCGQQVVWTASLDSCKCGQQVWTAVLSIDMPQHRNHFVGLVLSVALVVRVKEVNNILEREKKIGRLRCVSWVGIFPPLWVSFPMSPPWIGFCFVLRIFVLWGSRVRGMWSRLWLS